MTTTALAIRNVLQYAPPAVPLSDGALGEEEVLLRLTAFAQGAGPDVLGPLEPRVPDVLTTASGRIELASDALMGDVRRLHDLLATAGAASTLLVGRRHLRTNNSWMHSVAMLRGAGLCTLQVHPDDAGTRGVTDGGQARVTSDTGSIEVQVEVTEDIRPGVVSLPHGFGHDLHGIEQSVATARPGVNVNLLVDTVTIDPLSATSGPMAVPVQVGPA